MQTLQRNLTDFICNNFSHCHFSTNNDRRPKKQISFEQWSLFIQMHCEDFFGINKIRKWVTQILKWPWFLTRDSGLSGLGSRSHATDLDTLLFTCNTKKAISHKLQLKNMHAMMIRNVCSTVITQCWALSHDSHRWHWPPPPDSPHPLHCEHLVLLSSCYVAKTKQKHQQCHDKSMILQVRFFSACSPMMIICNTYHIFFSKPLLPGPKTWDQHTLFVVQTFWNHVKCTVNREAWHQGWGWGWIGVFNRKQFFYIGKGETLWIVVFKQCCQCHMLMDTTMQILVETAI